MKKIERVYRELLFRFLEEDNRELTQKHLSDRCEVAIGTVNYALGPLESMNAIEKRRRSFLVLDPKKILLHWTSVRNLRKDVVYKTHSDKDVRKVEQEMPSCFFTAYSGYKFRHGEPPAGYSEVWVYGDVERVRERFPEEKGKENVFVLEIDEHLEKFEEIPLGQLYVDLWNLDTWYASEFVESLEEIINGVLG
ncbi:MAG: hypothetical protein ACLFQ8_02400 [Candidatus Aenigmatarchaeota archaeon]